MESINVAKLLMFLSRGEQANAFSGNGGAAASEKRVFECKTCWRRFPSFQALGGHRASHKKPRLGAGGEGTDKAAGGGPAKPRVHECAVCGLEFAVGQALGGHMRRHRGATEGNGMGRAGISAERRRALLDLNLPPMEQEQAEDGKIQQRPPPRLLGFALTPALVDCLF
ncbi:hypothetical protein HPP92_006331 [Vanilla planifolia]|uniref:C2H2-type domain-containing protein n=1 Tax=Vanilla planifolia TaxID=51239 RepID=A0A835RNN2_VANPL|nr:hypothetical protein HPP92_006331 [Vanilla planifolia]